MKNFCFGLKKMPKFALIVLNTCIEMKNKIAQSTDIAVINISDVPQLFNGINYFDGEVAFADNIRTIPNLKEVFKVNFLAIVFCQKGTLSIKLNGTSHTVHEHEVLFIVTNTVVSDIAHTSDFDCKIVVIVSSFTLNFIGKSIVEASMRFATNPVVAFTPDESELMLKYYELLMFKIRHPQLDFTHEAKISILKSFGLDLLECINKHNDEADNNMMRQGDKLFQKFMNMLVHNDTNERSVQYFADKLYVSPKYLTSICNEKCGRTASELIAASIVGKIKQMLQYSSKSIKEIAIAMNFDNLSFFGKYVKKHLGDSPNNFRKRHAYGK